MWPVALVAVDVAIGDARSGSDRPKASATPARGRTRAAASGAARARRRPATSTNSRRSTGSRRGDQAQPGRAERVLVEVEPVQRRGKHDERQPAEQPSSACAAARPVAAGGATTASVSAATNELPEALARVLGVGQAGGAQDVVVAAEQDVVAWTATNAANSPLRATRAIVHSTGRGAAPGGRAGRRAGAAAMRQRAGEPATSEKT